MRLDVSPDGAHLVVIGNFTQVGGQYRPNIARLDVSGTAATVSSWFTDGSSGPVLEWLRHVHP